MFDRAEYNRQYYAANREREKQRAAAYRAANPEKTKAAVNAYAKTDWGRAIKAEVKKRYRARHRELCNARDRENLRAWRAAHPEQCRAKRCELESKRKARISGNRCEPYDRSEIFDRFDGLCVYCTAPAEVLDHVIPIARGGADAEDNLAPACRACNASKHCKPLLIWLLDRPHIQRNVP